MTPQLSILVRALIAVVTTTAAAACLTSPASAANPTAYLTQTQILSNAPTDAMPTSCKSERIKLGEDIYDWVNFVHSHSSIPPRSIHLRAGNYTWTTCLDPHVGGYTHTSYLDPDTAGWETETLSNWMVISTRGTYTWGNYLDPWS